MSRSRTRAKKQRLQGVYEALQVCIYCGQPGPHYVGPSLGEPGFFICARPAAESPNREDAVWPFVSGENVAAVAAESPKQGEDAP